MIFLNLKIANGEMILAIIRFDLLKMPHWLLPRLYFIPFSDNADMGGIVCVCMIAISLMLIYGAVKYKPSHLLPFFCLQLFDFAITT